MRKYLLIMLLVCHTSLTFALVCPNQIGGYRFYTATIYPDHVLCHYLNPGNESHYIYHYLWGAYQPRDPSIWPLYSGRLTCSGDYVLCEFDVKNK